MTLDDFFGKREKEKKKERREEGEGERGRVREKWYAKMSVETNSQQL
jgi:hypothetical protein